MFDELELYRTACAEVKVGVYEQNAAFEFTYFSPHLEKMLRTALGRHESEFQGQDPRQTFLFGASTPSRDNLLKQMLLAKGEPVVFEFCLTDPDGRVIWLQARESARFDESGAYLGSRGVYTDITQRKAAEDSNKAKSHFLTAISHELRTPLNAITGYTELIEEENLMEPDGVKYLDRIKAASKHLLGLMDDVLTFSALENPKDEVKTDLIDLAALLESLTKDAHALALSRGNQLRIDLFPQTLSIESDAKKLRRCLSILLSNAVKFTENGVIELIGKQDGDYVVLSVRDTGIGIPSEHHERIFLPFSQAENGLTRRADGLGIGLSLAQAIARQLKSAITLQSEPGHGSTFSVRLPLLGNAE